MSGVAGETRVRVAAAQYPPDQLATLESYGEKYTRWIGEAAAGGARLALFPEYASMELGGAAPAEIAASLPASLAWIAEASERLVPRFRDLARRHRLVILGPSGPRRRPDGAFVNAARVYGPDGGMVIVEKQIMTPFERDWGVSAGAPAPVIDTPFGRIGVAICYDCEFPLYVRGLAEAGAEIILIPSCTERRSGASRVRTGALARALESTIAAVVSPLVGEARWSPAIDVNVGSAGIYVPAEAGLSDTGVLVEGAPDNPQWVFGDIDIAALRRLRLGGEMANSADWSLQPGAKGRVAVTVVALA